MESMDDLLPLSNNDIVAGICGKAFLLTWLQLCVAAEPHLPQFFNTQSKEELKLIYMVVGYVFSLSLHPILQAYAKMILEFCRAATWFKVNLVFTILELLDYLKDLKADFLRHCLSAPPSTSPDKTEETLSPTEIKLIYLVKGYLFALSFSPIQQAYAKMILMFCQASTWVKVNLVFMVLEFLMGCGAPSPVTSLACFALLFYDLAIAYLFINRINKNKLK